MTDQQVDRLLDHEYDGIQEYDNRLPNWWLFILYASIVFAFGYWLVFHTLKIADLPVARYNKEMVAAAEAQLAKMSEGGVTDESLRLMSTIPEKTAQGQEIFQTFCVVCHNQNGPSKGMAAWGRQLGPKRVQLVVSYVLTLRNKEVPGKAPQGELYEGD